MDTAAGASATSAPGGSGGGGGGSGGGEGSEPAGKSIFTLLGEAFAIYRLNAKALLLTCALLFVPATVVKSWALSAVLAPTLRASDYMKQTAALGQKATEASRRALEQGVRDGKLDPKVVDEFTRQSARNLQELGRSNAVASGAVPSGFVVGLLEHLAVLVEAFILFGLVVPLIGGVLTISVADRILGGSADWRRAWRLLFRRGGRLLTALVPAAILVGVGFAAWVIPGVIVALFFSFVAPVVVIEGIGGRAAIQRSTELVRRDWAPALMLLIVFWILRWLAEFVAHIFFPPSAVFFGSLFGDLFTLVLMPIPILGSVLLYFDLRRTRDGFTQDRLRGDLAAPSTPGA